jgi:hypothetical protein
MADNSISILISAMLSKRSPEEIRKEIKKIESTLPKLNVKVDYSKSFSDYEKFWLKTVKTMEEKQVKSDNNREQNWLKNLKNRDIAEEKQVQKIATTRFKLEKNYDDFWQKNLKNREIQSEKQAQKEIEMASKVQNALFNQKQSIAVRDFNYGNIIDTPTSIGDSRSSFSSYIKSQYGDSAEVVKDFKNQMLSTGEVISQASFRVKEGDDKWRSYGVTLNKTTGEARLLDNGLKDVINRQLSFNEAMKIAVTRILQWGIATNMVYGTLRSIRSGLDTLRILDGLLVDIAKVSNLSADAMDRLKKSSFDAASAYGRTAQDYLKSFAEFSRAGYEGQAEGLSKVSLLAQNVGELTAEQANQFLLATDAAYKYAGSQEELTRVLDGVNQIDNKFATSISKVSEGIMVAGSVSSNAQVGISELAAAVGTMTAISQKSGKYKIAA